MSSAADDLLREALAPFPRWRHFRDGTVTATFEFSEAVYAAGFVTRALEQARAFNRIPDMNLAGATVRMALVLGVTREGLGAVDHALLTALERAANHPGRPAPVEAPILPVLADRWSPLSFTDEEVPEATLLRLFEAARWAPSSFNEQPWRYVVINDPARRDEAAAALDPGNAWARQAPVLILIAASKRFQRNSRTNRHAAYDAGAATAHLLAQATALGLVAHQMAGFDPDKAREIFHVPEKFEPLVMMALGWWGEGKGLAEDQLAREAAPRARKAMDEWLFWGDWGGARRSAGGSAAGSSKTTD
jgi:nitroreductase